MTDKTNGDKIAEWIDDLIERYGNERLQTTHTHVGKTNAPRSRASSNSKLPTHTWEKL